MRPERALADFIDYCLQRYARHPSYRATLERERPKLVAEKKRRAA